MPLYKRQDEDDDEDIVEDTEIVVQNNAPNEQPRKEVHEAEDLSWKDRYSNLRSYSSKKENELNKRIKALEDEMNSRSRPPLPKSKEEVEEWAKKFPEPYAYIESLIRMNLHPVSEDVNSKFKELEEEKIKLNKEKAKLKLSELQPDFFSDIMPSKEFAEWLDTKSKRLQDAMYEDDDPYAASEVISLYKAETGYGKKKTTSKPNSAAYVPSSAATRVNSNSGSYDFLESQIAQMSEREYDKNEEAIENARLSGRIHYDISGGAR